ncbi:MAG: queuosine precursor transporter [Bacteroidia bacterium]|nr:queuosine precursor transporter [Bacteroidia bacterium]
MKGKTERLFFALAAFFLTNAIVAEFIGVKVFSLERLVGAEPVAFSLFGTGPLSLSLSAGVLLWPWVFIATDIINEYFGLRAVRFLSWAAVLAIGYAFLMIGVAILLPPADFWIWRSTPVGPLHMPEAFRAIFGQSLWIVAGSLTAFLVGQLVDVVSFHWLRRLTRGRWLAVRATGSTLISQLIDSFIVLYIAFYWGAGWSFAQVTVIALLNYAYKAGAALLLTPVLYGVHWLIDQYLGKEQAAYLIEKAAVESAVWGKLREGENA